MKIKSLFLAIFLMAVSGSLRGQQQVQPVAGVLTLNLSPGISSFKTILGASVTSVVFTNSTPGTTTTVIFTENATGGFTVTFGGNISNPCTVATTANATTVCQFTYDSSSNTWNGVGSSSGGGNLIGAGVNPVSCTNCTDSYGVAQFLQAFQGTGSSTTFSIAGTRAKQGDTIVVGFFGFNASGVTVSSISDYCGNSWNPLNNLNAAVGNTIQLFYAWNVNFCPSDVITLNYSSAQYATIVTWDLRFTDTTSNPFDGQMSQGTTGASPFTTTNTLTTTNANDIVIGLTWFNGIANFGSVTAWTVGGTQLTWDSQFLANNSTVDPSLRAAHFFPGSTLSGSTSTVTWNSAQPDAGIALAAFRRLPTVPTTTINAKFDAKVALGATWANSGTVVTVAATDPQPLGPCTWTPGNPTAGDCGKVVFATSQGNAIDGGMTGGSIVIPQGVITQVSGSAITVSRAATAANSAANSDGVTGQVVWCSNDTDALRASWNTAITIPGVTVSLPLGSACFDGYLFIRFPRSSPQQLFDSSIIGVGATSTVLIPLPQFQYDPLFNVTTASLGLVYYDGQSNVVGPGNNAQKWTGPANIENWGIWGAVQPGSGFSIGPGGAGTSVPPPPIYIIRGVMRNWTCGSWNNAFGSVTSSNWPAIVASGSFILDSSALACGNGGISLLNAPITQFGSSVIRGTFGWDWGAGLVLSSSTLQYNHETHATFFGTSDFADHTISVANCNTAVCQTNAAWSSFGDIFYGSVVENGSNAFTKMDGSTVAKTNVGTAAINLSNGWLSPVNSVFSSFTQTGGIFLDNCGNILGNGSSAPWTTGTLSITGGTLYNSCSVTGQAAVAGNFADTTNLGTSTFTVGSGSSSSRGTVTITYAGTLASPTTFTFTFPTRFAIAPSSCVWTLANGGGTNTAPTSIISGAPSATAIAVTSTFGASPTAANTTIYQWNCGN